jgi:hypothetical protein
MESEKKTYLIKELRGICQSTAPDPRGESYVGRFCRIFSIYTTSLLIKTNLTPNKITVLSVFVFFAGIFLFFYGEYLLNLLAVLLIFLSIVLDGSDGEIARFKKNSGQVGSRYVEPVSHDIQYGFSFLIIGSALVINGAPAYYLFLGGLASILKLMTRLLRNRMWILSYWEVNEKIRNEQEKRIKEVNEKMSSFVKFVYWFEKNFLSSTGFLLSILIFVIFQVLEYSLWFYSIAYLIFFSALFLKQIIQIYKINPNESSSS